MPPKRSTMPFICSRGMFLVPLKFMCSTQCEAPVIPGPSSREPTRYQHHTDASGAVWISLTTTFRPLERYSNRTGAATETAAGRVIQILYRPHLWAFLTQIAALQSGFGAISSGPTGPALATNEYETKGRVRARGLLS